MSDPRTPLNEEPDDLGEIEDIEEVEGDADEGDPEDTSDVEVEGSDDGAEDEEGQGQRVARQPSRRERQAAHWRTRAETTERELSSLRRELDEIRTRTTAPPPVDPYAQQRAQEAENARVANMTYEEQRDYFRQKDRQEVASALQGIEFRMADRADKQAWESSTRDSPARLRLSAEVERTLQAERARGRNADREVIYKYLRGEELDRAEREGRGSIGRQRQAAQGRVRRQTTRPASGRGDTGRTGAGNRVDADERLLRGITAADI